VPDAFNTGPPVGTDISRAGQKDDAEELIHEIFALSSAATRAIATGIIDVETTELVDLERPFAAARIKHRASLLNL
jgi:hypothetical protein